MKTYLLQRNEDYSGVSGTGVVAEVVEFSDGVCVMHWLGRYHSTNIYSSKEELINIHGHQGRTLLIELNNENN